MKREFIINVILLLFINFLIKPIYIFGIDARVQNLVGTEAYGTYFAYFNFVFLFQFINDPGIQNWNAQYVPKNRSGIGGHMGSLLQIKVVLAIVFILSAWFFALISGYSDIQLIFFLCINMVLSSLFLLLRGAIAGLGYYKVDSVFSALDKLLMIIILGYLAFLSSYSHQFHIKMLIYGQGAAYLLSCIIACMFLVRKISFDFSILTWAYFSKVIKWSSPYVLILIFMTSYNKLDGVMLGSMIDDNHYQAGVYASAYRFYDAANMVGYLFAALLLPMFAANISDKKVLEELKNIGFRYTSVSALMLVMIIFFYGQDILKFLYKDYQPEFYRALCWLILSYLTVAIAYVFGTLLVAAGKVRSLNVLFGSGLLINIILNVLLIPKYLAIGAAAATFVTQIFVMAGQIFLSEKETGIGISGKEIFQIVIYAAVSIISFYFVQKILPFDWVYNLGLSILICLLLSFIFKIIDKREIFSLLKKE
jgi:O-antigen/teichoic acid export membrane protein